MQGAEIDLEVWLALPDEIRQEYMQEGLGPAPNAGAAAAAAAGGGGGRKRRRVVGHDVQPEQQRDEHARQQQQQQEPRNRQPYADWAEDD